MNDTLECVGERNEVQIRTCSKGGGWGARGCPKCEASSRMAKTKDVVSFLDSFISYLIVSRSPLSR